MSKKPEPKPQPKPQPKPITETAKFSKAHQQNFSGKKTSEATTNSTGPKKAP